MSERLPYWPCYAADITMSTAAMTDEQVGAYFRLLNHGWLNDGLPADLEAVRAIGRWTRPAFERLWTSIGPKWQEQDGRLVNMRQESERGKVARRSAAGKANALQRWHTNGTKNGNAVALPAHCKSDAFSESESERSRSKPQEHVSADADVLARFERFWLEYPNKSNKKTALKKWRQKRLSEAMTDVLITAVEAQKRSRGWLEGFIPHAATWLEGERWNDEVEAPRGLSTRAPVLAKPEPQDWAKECRRMNHQPWCASEEVHEIVCRREAREREQEPA